MIAAPSRPELPAGDRLAILDLYARYAHAFDEGREDEWPSLFTADGRLVHGSSPPTITQGREALAAMVRERLGAGIRHLPLCIAIEGTASGAHGSAYLAVVQAGDEGLSLRTAGSYDDDLVRADSGWRFAERRFTPWR